MNSTPKPTGASTISTPKSVLLRSRSEICGALRALAGEHCPIYTDLGDDRLFVSQILAVDESAGHVLVEHGPEQALNAALLEKPALPFESSHQDARVVFKLSDPVDTELDGKPAFRFAVPATLIFSREESQRRQSPRIAVPARMYLHCIAKGPDGDWFTAKITDVSQEGLGGMVHGKNVNLQVGMVLKECYINLPGGVPIPVDLVVRNTKTVVQADGTQYHRTGMCFVERPAEIQQLIDLFLLEQDKAEK